MDEATKTETAGAVENKEAQSETTDGFNEVCARNIVEYFAASSHGEKLAALLLHSVLSRSPQLGDKVVSLLRGHVKRESIEANGNDPDGEYLTGLIQGMVAISAN